MRRPSARVSPVTCLALGLMLCLSPLIAACGQPAQVARPPAAKSIATTTPVPIATPTRPPAAALAWQPRTLPVPFPASAYSPNAAPQPGLALTQADSATAYECAPDASMNAVHIWQTRDAGAHWAHTGDIATTSPAIRCTLVVDDLDPAILAATVYYPHPGYCCLPGPDLIVASRDSGQTWAPLRGPFDIISQLATRDGVTYALFHPHPVGADQLDTAFVLSRDGLRTWQQAPAPLGGYVIRFWLNSYDGRMLALTSTGYVNSLIPWTSTNAGQRWSSLNAPPYPFVDYDTIVQQPYTAASWTICGADPSDWFDGTQHNPHTHDLECTTDSGATWHIIHLDEATVANGQPEYTLLAVTDDGAVLLKSDTAIARLVPPSAHLDMLGTCPNAGDLVYSAGNGAGLLWAGPLGGYSDPQAHIFTAAYA